MEPGGVAFSFKCSPEKFAELVEAPGIVPAPYLARAHWVAFERPDALPRSQARELLRQAYDSVVTKLPKKTRNSLQI